MEVLNLFTGMSKVLLWFPSRRPVVIQPADQIFKPLYRFCFTLPPLPLSLRLDLYLIPPAIPDLLNVPLVLPLNLGWFRRGWKDSIHNTPFPGMKLVDMEDGVLAGEPVGELEAIVEVTDLLSDAEWAKVAVAELTGGDLEGNVLGAEPDVVVHLEGVGLALPPFVALLLLGLLYPESGFDLLADFAEALKSFVDSSDTRGRGDRDVEVGKVAVDDFEGGVTVGGMDTGVDDEFSHREVSVPVILSSAGVKA